jgi:hypothetical protein
VQPAEGITGHGDAAGPRDHDPRIVFNAAASNLDVAGEWI